MSFLDNYTKEDIEEIVKNSQNIVDVLQNMNKSPNSGSNRAIISQYIKDHNINISHFKNSKISLDDIFIKNSIVTQRILRLWYKKGNYTEYKCSICGQEPIWNNKPLTLTLDHINGVNNDNRLNNLRWVCPNCDRQLPTFGSKNKKEKAQSFKCIQCGKPLSKKRKTGLCINCYKKQKTLKSKCLTVNYCEICGKQIDNRSTICTDCHNKKRREEALKAKEEKGINREFLKQEIRNKPFTTIAKEQGVSDNAIRKWCKKFNLPHKSTEIKKYSDEEWEKI